MPRRRGRPPGSTNKKKRLQQQLQAQQQQLLSAMSAMVNGTTGVTNPMASVAPSTVGNPFLAGLVPPIDGRFSHSSLSQNHHSVSAQQSFAAAAAFASAIQAAQQSVAGAGLLGAAAAAAAAAGVSPLNGLLRSGRRPRGESRKCRKVYGMDNREMWCTQCKWKKACTRFMD